MDLEIFGLKTLNNGSARMNCQYFPSLCMIEWYGTAVTVLSYGGRESIGSAAYNVQGYFKPEAVSQPQPAECEPF